MLHEVILLKNGEIVLKGLNRSSFEEILIKNIKRRLNGIGKFSVVKSQSTITIEPASEDFDFDSAIVRLKKIFGIAAISRALVVPKDMEIIRSEVCSYLKSTLSQSKSFKVESKRSDKRFPMTSPQISSDIGGVLLENFPNLTVDVHNPEIVVNIEIRDYSAYIHAGSESGACGMPVSSNGKACLLVSGGIDSPVAGYMMAKRGVELCTVHFASPPYTSERAKAKVLELLKIVSEYSGRIACFVVPFTEIQEQIKNNCPEELFTVIMRRLMIKIAVMLSEREHCSALITGESVGQVASQTMEAIICTDAACGIPIFRPLIGMDKEEIISLSRKIGTYETSILPYEDCCTVFSPRHPRIKPKLNYVEKAEAKFDFAPLLEQAFLNAEKIIVG